MIAFFCCTFSSQLIESLVVFQCTTETIKAKDLMVSGTVIHRTAHQAHQFKVHINICNFNLLDSIILKSVVS